MSSDSGSSDSSSTALDLADFASGETESIGPAAHSRFADAEAEEVEDSDSDSEDLHGRESSSMDSNQEIAPFVEPNLIDASAAAAAAAPASGAGGGAAAAAPAACSRSFVSETDDDGFMALAEEFADPFVARSPASRMSRVAAEAVEAADAGTVDPNLPCDPHTLAAEKQALEGAGASQLRLELRSLELTGMKLLKADKATHTYPVFVRKLLASFKASHIRLCLNTTVQGRHRGEYLFDRLRRRYWARMRGSATADLNNEPLPLLTGTVTVQVPLEPQEAGLVGAVLSPEVARRIGSRAVGRVVPREVVRKATSHPDVEKTERLVVLSAEVETVYSTSIASGSYGSYRALVAIVAELAPAREGGTLTGVVTELSKPEYQLTRSIAAPTKKGTATLCCGAGRFIGVPFAAEVPVRAAALGRVWVVRLQKNKDREWFLEFALDPFVLGTPGDTEDLHCLAAKEVSDMNLHRRPTHTPQISKNWTAVNDASTGFRVLKQLPDTGFWCPTTLHELYGDKYVRGQELHIGMKRYMDESVDHVVITTSDHVVGHKTSQRAILEMQLDGKKASVSVFSPFEKEQAKNSALLCRKVGAGVDKKHTTKNNKICPPPPTHMPHSSPAASKLS